QCTATHLLRLCMLPPPLRSALFPYTTLFRSPRIPSHHARVPPRREERCGVRVAIPAPTPAPARGRFRENEMHDIVGIATRTPQRDRKSTRLNSSHVSNSYAVFCLKKKKSYRP